MLGFTNRSTQDSLWVEKVHPYPHQDIAGISQVRLEVEVKVKLVDDFTFNQVKQGIVTIAYKLTWMLNMKNYTQLGGFLQVFLSTVEKSCLFQLLSISGLYHGYIIIICDRRITLVSHYDPRF